MFEIIELEIQMFTKKQKAAMLDIGAGTTLIIVGIIGVLARLGVFENNQLAHWSAVEHWWPLLVIIAGLIMWLSDMEEVQKTRQSRQKLEIPYGD
jgi:uncharacterized protein (DUF983 family)